MNCYAEPTRGIDVDTMTAENRALHYMRWHVAAYGAPAPMDEIAAGLYDSHGMTETQSHDLLVRMRKDGKCAYTEGEFVAAGWHEVPHNVGAERRLRRTSACGSKTTARSSVRSSDGLGVSARQ
jgi:hypothetical protein